MAPFMPSVRIGTECYASQDKRASASFSDVYPSFRGSVINSITIEDKLLSVFKTHGDSLPVYLGQCSSLGCQPFILRGGQKVETSIDKLQVA